ncbi:hypothetical protein [Streptomyces sp. NRRL B-24484]|uniref:hypothetical protein n=1 Tax=Streptomyces sp. NRRL B-24484 TaxID=1463833 RepID=UPI0004BF73E0|nr:hypothetical protein [Streptomyces sp. NRRL B-24484]
MLTGHSFPFDTASHIGAVAVMGGGVVLLATAAVFAAGHRRSGGRPQARSRDAWIFFAILVFALALVAMDTPATRLAAVGTLVVTCARAWYRKGAADDDSPAGPTHKSIFSVRLRGLTYRRTSTEPAEKASSSKAS